MNWPDTAKLSTSEGSKDLVQCRHGGGVLEDISDTLVAVVIPEGAHHLDLMFSHPLDPPSVLAARETERSHMRRWIAQAAARRSAVA